MKHTQNDVIQAIENLNDGAADNGYTNTPAMNAVIDYLRSNINHVHNSVGVAPSNVFMRVDDRSESVDVKLLYRQKSALLRAVDNCTSETDAQLLKGLINYCDYQVDYLDSHGQIWDAVKDDIENEKKIGIIKVILQNKYNVRYDILDFSDEFFKENIQKSNEEFVEALAKLYNLIPDPQ